MDATCWKTVTGHLLETHTVDGETNQWEWWELTERDGALVRTGKGGRIGFDPTVYWPYQLDETLGTIDGKGAVAFKAAPVVEGSWDASAATGRVFAWADGDMAKYRQAFAWFDASKPENKGSYSLPHHDIQDGKLVTVKRGVQAAAQRLGSTEMPEADRAAVRAHLGKHYKQWGEDPPWDREGKYVGPTDEPPATTPPAPPVTLKLAPLTDDDLSDRVRAEILRQDFPGQLRKAMVPVIQSMIDTARGRA
jgi:hypothetical protein